MNEQNGIVAENIVAVQEEWLRDESEHPYKFVPTKTSGNTVPFPAITKCNTYILRHYAADIVEEIEQRMYDGDLAMYFDISDFTEDCMTMRDCRISPSMSFWWQDRFSFLTDLEVYIEADVHTDSICGRQSCTVYATVSFDFEEQITYSLEGFSLDKPDRDIIKLDDYLIPIMSYEEVEEAAEQMHFRYLAIALRDRRCINAFQLAKAMGLNIESHRLYHKPKTKSVLYWKESKVLVQLPGSDEKDPPVEITIPADTIVTNENLIPQDNRSLHIFHECFHAEYHWLFYRLQDMHNSDLRTIKKKRKVKNQGKEPKNPLPILEWEAKRGSHALQMPRSLAMPQFRNYAEEEQQRLHHMSWALENVGSRVSDEWGIPKYLVRARLLHLGFWQAQGSLNYVQQTKEKGNYIRPFLFDRESCPGTSHTFVISPLDAFKLYERNEEYRVRIDSGAYVYVGGHVCLNDPEYVMQTKYGPRMTEWANRHVDECCLRFENIYEVDDNYEFHLNSINSDEEYNRHYNDFVSDGRELTPTEASEMQSTLIASLPASPGKALRALMDYKGVTNASLAEAALVSGSSVDRWLREEYSYSPEVALRIIVGLHMPPWLSAWFLDMTHVPLTYHGKHLLYRHVINCRYMDPMTEIITLINESGYKMTFRETA